MHACATHLRSIAQSEPAAVSLNIDSPSAKETKRGYTPVKAEETDATATESKTNTDKLETKISADKLKSKTDTETAVGAVTKGDTIVIDGEYSSDEEMPGRLLGRLASWLVGWLVRHFGNQRVGVGFWAS